MLLVLGLLGTLGTEALAQKKKKKESSAAEAAKPATPAAKSTSPKAYKEVITSKAKTDEGLFKVHKVDDSYFYEIPDSLLGRDMLLVSRIAKTAENIGYGGEELNTSVVRWELKDKKVLLRLVSYRNVASEELPIYQAVKNSNFEPVVAAFEVKAAKTDSTGTVIEVGELFTTDVKLLGLEQRRRTQYKVTALDTKRSYLDSIRSYPLNIEARHVLTYNATEPPSTSETGSISLEMNHSMVLLPKKPMTPRLKDQRVGYFSVRQNDYGLDEQKADKREYIVRWRLEPKDPAAYARGELVEPVKPIVYYIDPATPEKWRPYIKQGVEDWQAAFEQAGFKNAILCKYPPTKEEDPEFSPEDARYSVVRYFASDIQNAYGPNVHDPRSGEILESDIGWYHNVMNLIRNWFFIQTATINPDARTPKFKDEVMGRLIRFVSSHEVGHTLGLPHNMGSSAAYPVDSLRSATFTQKYSVAPSIMDYARFNYVAQPDDKGVSLMPNIGLYDKYAIEWGYRALPGVQKPEDERKALNDMIMKHAHDPIYRYGRQTANPTDPRSQTEDLGDDAMKASEYGIQNLKRLVPELVNWTKEEGKPYDNLEEMYGQVLGQWSRYMGHVASNVGGIYETYKTYDQEGAVYTPVEKAKQKRAVQFINNQAFKTPTWMIQPELVNRFEGVGMVERIRTAQERVLNNLLEPGRMARLIEHETLHSGQAYSLLELMGDLRTGIWTELKNGQVPDTYRRNLQRTYLDRLEYLMTKEPASVPASARGFLGYVPVKMSQSDIRSVVRGELGLLQTDIRKALPTAKDTLTKYHLQDALVRIEKILDPKE
ncbi:zinc-dependent metalloprotease [Rhabdobacter roseus]